MKRIGIISDIHNNVIALEAVLRNFAEQRCERVICAGDIIGIGPYPEETVQRIKAIPNLIAVKGNHEKYLSEGIPTNYPNDVKMGYEEMEHHKWEHSQLSQSSIEFLNSLPYRVDFNEYGVNFSVMHYCMDCNNKYINYTPHPAEADLIRMFPEENRDVVIFGHDHARIICHSVSKWFINSGSLGCPAKDKGIARSAILEITDENNILVNSIEVSYNSDKVIADIDLLKYPACEEIKRFFSIKC